MSETTQRRLALTGALVFYVVILVVASEPDVSDVDWGDAPTWLAGGVALAALVAAWRAGSIAAELLRVERSREDDRAWRDASSQARLVSAWIDVGYQRDEFGSPTAVESLTGFVRNASAVPVHDVEVSPLLDRRDTVDGGDWLAARLEWPTLPPSDEPRAEPILGPVVALVDSAARASDIAVRCKIAFTAPQVPGGFAIPMVSWSSTQGGRRRDDKVVRRRAHQDQNAAVLALRPANCW
jgi:hypothetical protein